MKMHNKLFKTCLTGIVLSVAGLANAEVTAGPVTIFTPQLMSHAATVSYTHLRAHET